MQLTGNYIKWRANEHAKRQGYIFPLCMKSRSTKMINNHIDGLLVVPKMSIGTLWPHAVGSRLIQTSTPTQYVPLTHAVLARTIGSALTREVTSAKSIYYALRRQPQKSKRENRKTRH